MDVHSAGAHLHDEQGMLALQADRVHMEQVGGQQSICLSLEDADHLPRA
ncbi:hypothetical protein [Streptomyces sp. NPDC001970]